MRHRKNKRIIGSRSTKANLLYRDLAASLILHGKISTTKKRAQLLQPLIAKVITISCQNSLSNKRRLHNLLKSKEAEKKAWAEFGKKYKDKKGGYTRILKLNRRQGDGAQLVQIELL